MVQRLTSLVKDLENVESVCKDQIAEFAKSERPLNLQKSRHSSQRSTKKIQITISDHQFSNGDVTTYREHDDWRNTTQINGNNNNELRLHSWTTRCVSPMNSSIRSRRTWLSQHHGEVD